MTGSWTDGMIGGWTCACGAMVPWGIDHGCGLTAAPLRVNPPNPLQTIIDELRADLAASRRQCEALREAMTIAESRFANYGRHHGWCESQKREAPCNCGYEQALAALATPTAPPLDNDAILAHDNDATYPLNTAATPTAPQEDG